MAKKGTGKAIERLLVASARPLSTRELAEKLHVSWHTADRYCLKLQVAKKVDCFTIGKATAWFLKT